jgi:hypothetical protein
MVIHPSFDGRDLRHGLVDAESLGYGTANVLRHWVIMHGVYGVMDGYTGWEHGWAWGNGEGKMYEYLFRERQHRLILAG